MIRQRAAELLIQAGLAEDDAFPLLEATIACALHDDPRRDARGVHHFIQTATDHLCQRLDQARQSTQDETTAAEALGEVLAVDFQLSGARPTASHAASTDVIDVVGRRRGQPPILAILYAVVGTQAGLKIHGVDFPGHVMVRLETQRGFVVIDPFCDGEVVRLSDLTQRALRLGLSPHVAEQRDLLLAAIQPRELLLRLQNVRFLRALKAMDYETAERAALRSTWLDPLDHCPWLDVAVARERQGALAGALEALDRARGLDELGQAGLDSSIDRVRLLLN